MLHSVFPTSKIGPRITNEVSPLTMFTMLDWFDSLDYRHRANWEHVSRSHIVTELYLPDELVMVGEDN